MRKYPTKEEINYYSKQSPRISVRKGTFDDFPNDVAKIVRIIQGLLIHPSVTKDLYNLDFSKTRIRDRHLKTVREIVAAIKKIDSSPLIIPREPSKRMVGICRQFSMLLCSILREKGFSARTRCGFATYFQGGWFEDHWICEYWSKSQKRWISVDAQMDDIQAVAYHVDRSVVDFLDLPRGEFFPAGVLWKLYRDGFIGEKVEGFSDSEGASGEWYIRANMLRDFFSLNRIPYDYSEEDSLMKKDYALKAEELSLLDEISLCTSKPDVNFEKMRELFESNKSLLPTTSRNRKSL